MITSVTELYAAVIRPSTSHLLSRDYSPHYGPMTLMRKEFVNALSKVTGFLRLLRFIPQEMLLGWVLTDLSIVALLRNKVSTKGAQFDSVFN